MSHYIRRATIEDKKAIYDLIANTFLEDMPLIVGCGIKQFPSIDQWSSLQLLKNGMSLVAVSNDDIIVGVAIIFEPSRSKNPVVKNTHFQPLLDFIEVLDKDSKGLVSELETSTLELRLMAVTRDFRGKGISKQLIREAENVATSSGHSKIFAIATGAYMAAAFKRENWKTVHTYFYKNYVELNSNFKLPPAPHDRTTIFEKRF